MNDLLAALLLGLLEGLTEFLPISSTGHLLIAQHWLGPRSDLFNIVIQSGAILAVALVFRERLLRLALGWRDPEQFDYILKLGVAFLVTALVGLPVRLLGWELPETVAPVALALVIGGVLMLGIERLLASRPTQAEVGWNVAVWVGLAQVVAGVFPGTSRSAAAIFAAMLAGALARPVATEFAFLVGIPTMFAASAFAIAEYVTDGGAPHEDWAALALAFTAAALTGFAVVRWLMAWIKGHSFAPFAWYRIALGVALLLFLPR
ncbi:MAG: undecaprenyl-diphosphate phosphatase [Lysobacteraceae bacterium]